ncbi:type I restriction enzyme HsdR N-terminal domain-containing protein [Pontibacter vulgaris]|uniref:type I restriction enzyme HsdR N-terminal domain-containing protein n=1 Tax=Pontibacter vulgaris TaxID=2905679 RepID=UPI001FA6D2F8|nr:type I restriction enzyme HsdR N-terminal domain-containing protein [Pontibacter vulgaris]
MDTLNLPPFEYKLKQSEANSLIFDALRRKYVLLTPEEWVRQHFLHYLLNQLHYPKSLISVERGTTYNKLQKRTDICIYNNMGQPHLLVECKAAYVPITQEVVKQVSTYNQALQAKYVAITNGLEHFCWEVDFKTRRYLPLQEIPVFQQEV